MLKSDHRELRNSKVKFMWVVVVGGMNDYRNKVGPCQLGRTILNFSGFTWMIHGVIFYTDRLRSFAMVFMRLSISRDRVCCAASIVMFVFHLDIKDKHYI